MTVRFLTIALLACFTVGCVNNYDGTRIEADIRIRETSTFKRADVVLPTRDASPGDPTYFSHYELHANILGAGTIRLKTFIIQPAVQVDHPCLQYQDDWFCRETETSPCPDYINMERFANLEDILVAVTVAPTVPAGAGGYLHAPAYDLMNPLQFPDFLFLDPDETVDGETIEVCVGHFSIEKSMLATILHILQGNKKLTPAAGTWTIKQKDTAATLVSKICKDSAGATIDSINTVIAETQEPP